MIAGSHSGSGAGGALPPPLPNIPPVPTAANGQGLFAWYAPGFSDALGDRLLLFDNTDGRPLELLRLRPELAEVAGFEASLRERSLQLAAFADPRFARVCRVDWLPDPGGGLAIVSEHVEGRRLSEVLAQARGRGGLLTADLTLALLRDLVSAVAALQQQGADVAHGALGPERLVVTPRGRLLVTEYVLGLALRRLGADAPVARDLRIDTLPGTEAVPCDQRQDVRQIGITALALLLARVPAGGVEALLDEVDGRAAVCGWDEPRWDAFRSWLHRALQREGHDGFANATEAALALEQIAPRRPALSASGAAIARFVADCADAQTEQAGTAGDQEVRPGIGVEVAPSAAAPDDTGQVAAGAELLAFPSEGPLAPGEGEKQALDAARGIAGAKRASRRNWFVGVLALLVVLEGAYIGSRLIGRRGGAATTLGTLRLDSDPARANVSIDGRAAGVTPGSIRLAPGRHQVELSIGNRRRSVAVTLEAGGSVSQFVELPPEVLGVGDIDVRTEPPGARVTVDGQPRGTSPVVVKGLAVGAHEVRVDRRGRVVSQSVAVEEAGTANLFIPFAGGAPAAGWLSIASTLELQVYEDDRLLGTSESERIMLPAGRHEISLANEAAGFRTSREVTVPVGGTAELEIDLPMGALDINASPWAEVSVDGQKVGETPLSGVPARLGRHRVTFRHPALGERTVECVVTLKQAARVSVDLRK